MRLVEHHHLAAAVALYAQEPGRERAEHLSQRRGGRRQRLGAVGAPVSLGGGRQPLTTGSSPPSGA
jgi:hypothetical protein